MAENWVKIHNFMKTPEQCFKLLFFNTLEAPPPTRSRREVFFGFLKNLFCHVLVFFFIILYYASMIAYTLVNQLSFKETPLLLYGAAPSQLCKLIILWTNRSKIQCIASSLKNMLARKWQRWTYLEIMRIEKVCRRFNKVTKALLISGVMTALMSALSSSGHLNLPSLLWLPFDLCDIGTFSLVYLWNIASTTVTAIHVAGFDSVFLGCLASSSIQFHMLSREFMKIDSPNENAKKQIVDLIKQHIELLEITKNMEDVFSAANFTDFIGITVTACFTAFGIANSGDDISSLIEFVFIITLIFLKIFILFFFSQSLMDSSLRVAEGVYNMNWHMTDDLEVWKMIQVIILRANQPVVMTSLGFAALSLESYGVVSLKA